MRQTWSKWHASSPVTPTSDSGLRGPCTRDALSSFHALTRAASCAKTTLMGLENPYSRSKIHLKCPFCTKSYVHSTNLCSHVPTACFSLLHHIVHMHTCVCTLTHTHRDQALQLLMGLFSQTEFHRVVTPCFWPLYHQHPRNTGMVRTRINLQLWQRTSQMKFWRRAPKQFTKDQIKMPEEPVPLHEQLAIIFWTTSISKPIWS